MTHDLSAAHAARRREVTRRTAVLTLVNGGLAAGLFAFYTRQSMITRLSLGEITRVLLPTAQLKVAPAAPADGTALAVPVIVYHGVVPRGEHGNVTPETFRTHMVALKKAGYTTLTMDDFRDFMLGKKQVPARSVLLTFDDGRTDTFMGADPVLKKLGLHATMFTILGDARSGKSFYLTLDETKMMARTGRWDVHSHTTDTHVNIRTDAMGKAYGHALAVRRWDEETGRLESDDEWLSRVATDLVEAKRGVAELSGKEVYAFAYPWGDYGQTSEDPLIRTKLRQIGGRIYPLTFAQQKETLDETHNYPSDFGHIMRRIYVHYDMTADDLIARLERGDVKPLPFRDVASFASAGWSLTAGQLVESGSGRDLVDKPGDTNAQAEAFLDGSRRWRDYAVRSRFSLQPDEGVGIVARRVGPSDYLVAIVQQRYACIEQWVGNERISITEGLIDMTAAGRRPHNVSFAVQGQTASLEVDGTQILNANVDAQLSHGGIAFRVEPPRGQRARLHLDDLSVTSLEKPAAESNSNETTPGTVTSR